jgi:hypothetical protein
MRRSRVRSPSAPPSFSRHFPANPHKPPQFSFRGSVLQTYTTVCPLLPDMGLNYEHPLVPLRPRPPPSIPPLISARWLTKENLYGFGKSLHGKCAGDHIQFATRFTLVGSAAKNCAGVRELRHPSTPIHNHTVGIVFKTLSVGSTVSHATSNRRIAIRWRIRNNRRAVKRNVESAEAAARNAGLIPHDE